MSEQPQTFRLVRMLNAQVTGKRFKAQLIEPGIVSFEDSKQGRALIKKQTLDQCVQTFVGTPIVVKHQDVDHTNKARKCAENGVIESVYYDGSDGFYWCEGSVNSAHVRNSIQTVGKVSCGYDITAERKANRGETYHCLPFDYEILGLLGNHLAIEAKPRYEDAKIRLNSKQTTPTSPTMFKWFKKQSAGADDAAAIEAKKLADAKAKADADAAAETARLNALKSAEGAEDISGETEILVGEEKVKLSDLTAGYIAHRDNAKASDGSLPEDASIEVDGAPVPVAELVASHKARKNAEAEAAKVPKVFRVVNARAEANKTELPKAAEPDTQEARLKRGKEQY